MSIGSFYISTPNIPLGGGSGESFLVKQYNMRALYYVGNFT